jgi:signal transduction histidine kinase/CheY-like chemotaxis protein
MAAVPAERVESELEAEAGGDFAEGIGEHSSLPDKHLRQERDRTHWMLLEFMSPQVEKEYIADLWSRESARSISTFVLVAMMTTILLIQSYLVRPGMYRRPVIVFCAVLLSSVVALLILIGSSKRVPLAAKIYSYMRGTHRALPFIMVVAVVTAPLPALYNMYRMCGKDPASARLNHCVMLDSGFVPYDTTIYVLFAPMILAYSNVKFKIAIWPCLVSIAQLVAIWRKVLSDGGARGCFADTIEIRLANPLLLFLWPWGLMCIAMWHIEKNDRKLYMLRKVIENRHATQLELTHLESKAAAEETLMSFLCHGKFVVFFAPPPSLSNRFWCTEIRNPYNGLIGYAELTHNSLERILNPSKWDTVPKDTLMPHLLQIQGWCNSVISSSRHMLELLDNVLDLSKLENKKMVLNKQAMNMHSVCQEVYALLAPTIKPGVAVNINTDNKLWIKGDRLRWSQLLVNLLSNALKFTDHGCVEMRIKSQGAYGGAGSGAEDYKEGGVLDVEIIDTGRGVTPETAKKLFSKFQQGGFHPGSGVGLALSQHIAMLMGSEIRVQSPYKMGSALGSGNGSGNGSDLEEGGGGVGGPGTRLFFSVAYTSAPPLTPLAEQVADLSLSSPLTSAKPPPAKMPHSLKILVCEDDAMNQLIMKAKLQDLQLGDGGDEGRRCEVECTVADTAEKAIELITEGKEDFDVILMDQHLENAGGTLTGMEAVGQLRGKGYTLPIIMCSGNCSARDAESYLEAGASHVWPKPYPPTQQMADDLQNAILRRSGT